MKQSFLLVCGVSIALHGGFSYAQSVPNIIQRSVVRDCEKMVAHACEEAMQVLVSAQIAAHEGTLSLSSRTQVRQQINILEHIRETLFCVMRRGDPDYYDAVCSTMEANFVGTTYNAKPFDPKKAYEALGMSTKEGKKLSAEFIASLIDDELVDTTVNAERKKLLRQLRYIFANEYAKQEYDAYLQGKRAVEALCISSNEEERMVELIEQVMGVKAALREVSKVSR